MRNFGIGVLILAGVLFVTHIVYTIAESDAASSNGAITCPQGKYKATVNMFDNYQKGFVLYDFEKQQLSVNTEHFTHSFKSEKEVEDIFGIGIGFVRDECGDLYVLSIKISSKESFERAIKGEDIKPYVILEFSTDLWIKGVQFKLEGREAIEFVRQGVMTALMGETETAENAKEKEVTETTEVPSEQIENAVSQKSSSLYKHTIRFEIISNGIVENEPCAGYIELDTLNNVWGFYLADWTVSKLKEWKDNPHGVKDFYLDSENIDYIISPYVYEKGENRYYILFRRYETCGSEFRITSESARQYLKLWYPQFN